jgi:hypothetical protein
MQGDGDLILYDGVLSRTTVVWTTDTSDIDPALRPFRAEMGSDGNLVLYSDLDFPVWDTGSNSSQESQLVVENDGQAVIYDGSGTAVWTSRNLTFQAQVPGARATEPVMFDTGLKSLSTGKEMRTSGILYSNGQVSVDMYAKNRHWASGLRPRAVLSIRDAEARRIFVSEVLVGRTFCAVPDLSCTSDGPAGHWDLSFPLEVNQVAVGVDISQFDGPSSDAFRKNLCTGIRYTVGKDVRIPEDLKQVILETLRC